MHVLEGREKSPGAWQHPLSGGQACHAQSGPLSYRRQWTLASGAEPHGSIHCKDTVYLLVLLKLGTT